MDKITRRKKLAELGTVYITKDSHEYKKGLDTNLDYSPVSNVIAKYKLPYNSKYWSRYKALQKILMARISLELPHLVESGLEKRAKTLMKNAFLEYFISDEIQSEDTPMVDTENMEALNFAIEKLEVPWKEFEEARQEILDSWKNTKDTASHKGNVYHRAREINAIVRGYETNAFDNGTYKVPLEHLMGAYFIEEGSHPSMSDALVWGLDFAEEKRVLTDDPFNDLPDGFYPELMLSDDEFMVAGTADRVFIETILGQRFVDIDDYKTPNDIPRKSFYVRGQGYKMMQYPVNHLMDCKHSYYNLQVSIYAYLLERKGFIVRKVGYHHLNTLNECEYLRTEAMDVLQDYKQYKDNLETLNNV